MARSASEIFAEAQRLRDEAQALAATAQATININNAQAAALAAQDSAGGAMDAAANGNLAEAEGHYTAAKAHLATAVTIATRAFANVAGGGPKDEWKLGGVDNIILTFEATTGWRVSIAGRLVIQQFFISLATDRFGFKDARSMSDDARQQAIDIAYSNLNAFLNHLKTKAEHSEVYPTFNGRYPSSVQEIGLLLIVQNISSWALQINCPCWPR